MPPRSGGRHHDSLRSSVPPLQTDPLPHRLSRHAPGVVHKRLSLCARTSVALRPARESGDGSPCFVLNQALLRTLVGVAGASESSILRRSAGLA